MLKNSNNIKYFETRFSSSDFKYFLPFTLIQPTARMIESVFSVINILLLQHHRRPDYSDDGGCFKPQ